MKRLLTATLLFLGCLSGARAQTVATVTGHEIFPSAGPPTNASVCFSLQNFKPNIPRIASTGIVIQQQNWCITPSTVDGSFSVPIVRNDAINPAGTIWRVDFLWNGIQQSSASYLINHTPFNLDVEIPLNQIPVVGPNQIITQVFTCPQLTALTTWTCTHNFNDINVQVQTFDSSGHVIYPDTIVDTSPNVVTITFVSPQSGLAVIVHAGSVALATNQPNAVLQNPTGTQSICCFSLTVSAPFIATNTATFSGAVTDNGTHTFNGSVTFAGSLIASTIGPSSGQQHILPAVASDTFTLLSASQTLINKVFDVTTNTLKTATNVSGNVLRNNGTQYVDATLSASDLSNGVSGNGAIGLINGPSFTSPTITTPTINGASSGTGLQGTDSKLLTAGTISGTGFLCGDANGGATNSGCTALPVIQVAVNSSVCTTGAGAGSSCTTTVSWPSNFADTGYRVTCGGIGPTQFPFYTGITSKLIGSVTVQITNGTSNEAQASTFSSIECIGIHP